MRIRSRYNFPLFLVVLLGTISPLARCLATDKPPELTAAVFNFEATGDNVEGKGKEATAMLEARLSSVAPNVILVERQELDKVLGEQELGLSGTVDPETAAKVGTLLGAKVLVTGRLFATGGKFFLAAKVIGTETSRVYGETADFGDIGALDKGVAELAAKIGADIEKHTDTLVAKVEDPEARIGRLKRLVAGQPLPSVSVVIREQHIGQFILDPAAQTEMKRILQLLGCEVIDPAASNRRPDVEITGEAFSESAGRRGNLLSDRARVEIKVVRTATGKLLLTDIQSDVAIDLAENIAGKTALENAADRLLDRIVPKLVEP